MVTMKVWAGLDECRDVESLYEVASDLRQAVRIAEAACCEVELVEQEIGDQRLGVTGSSEAIVAAARAFIERGFQPVVYAGTHSEYEFLDLQLGEGRAAGAALELQAV